jgi:putative ABC transport system ATP-binding protein
MPFDDTIFLKQNVDVLSFFTDEQLRKVTSVIERHLYKKGQTVIFKGEVTHNFFVIKRGKVDVLSKDPQGRATTTELKAGDFFGEMSLLDPTAATATIRAAEDDTEVLTIPHDAFQFLLKQNPLLESTLRQRISARKSGAGQ